ncbi:alpha/beta fold hydrolase [Enterovibrio norvegicus]|uniref:alpha/beta fold hydrolase n=1 Tax=Enterovibrio norvegicus TaxID=188144 RepID=UPI000C85CE15|nr:alpha/beta hydrolase [Enterovibrio norvegicus]PMH64516.1 alpha/beta hydrolase [Enterovibrio norvegicus]
MKQVILNNKMYRYTANQNNSTNQIAIFLLGALQDISSVSAFSEHFSETLNCITVEIPGTGFAQALEPTVTIREQTEMLIDFIQYMDIKSAHIIGFSYATAIAVELCAQWKGVKSLSICGGIPGIPSSGVMATKRMIAAAMQSKEEFATSFIDSLTVDNPKIPRSLGIKKAMRRNISKMEDDRIQMFFDNSVRLLVHKPSDISHISVPSLICAAEFDPYVTKEVAKQFSDELSNSSFYEIKNADHLAHLQYPNIVARALILLASSSVTVERTLAELTI